jgi:hypothetical protein
MASELLLYLAGSSLYVAATNQGWKPVTLRTPMLGGFIILSLVVIALLEVLSQKSLKAENGGGLVFAANVNRIPSSKNFHV